MKRLTNDSTVLTADISVAKIRDALNSSLYDTLKERIHEIEQLCQDIRNHAEASHLSESRDHRITSEQTNEITRDTNVIIRQTNDLVIDYGKHIKK